MLVVPRSIERIDCRTVPIVPKRRCPAAMVQHHRPPTAGRLSLLRVPCLLPGYVPVCVARRPPGFQMDGVRVVERVMARMPCPPKTTRQLFLQPLPVCSKDVVMLSVA